MGASLCHGFMTWRDVTVRRRVSMSLFLRHHDSICGMANVIASVSAVAAMARWAGSR